MAKFRTKIKRLSKGKAWKKGFSSTTNPKNCKHREKAKSRFFHHNLTLAPSANVDSALTEDRLKIHNARLLHGNGSKDPTISQIAGSLKSFSIADGDGDDIMFEKESQGRSIKSCQSFASMYSTCTNMSFNKLMSGFRENSEQHREMLAILTALTEIIKERGGTESSTEYFILLLEALESSTNDSEIKAGLMLLAMGIRSVPVAVLRKSFSQTATILINFLEKFMNAEENLSILKYIIRSLTVLLIAQDYSAWSYPSTLQYFDVILTFTIHSKPKVRKSAQQAITSILYGSSFLKNNQNTGEIDESKIEKTITHPAAVRLAKFCLKQFDPTVLSSSQTVILHVLGLLKSTISVMKNDDIRYICENLLSVMALPNVLIRTMCFETLYSLFSSKCKNLTAILCGKLISAIYDYRPDKTDVRQTIAWLTVLKYGHIHLSELDLNMCISSMPKFIDVCTSDLWISDRSEIVSSVANTIKELFNECIKLACISSKTCQQFSVPINKCIHLVGKTISAPFGDVAKFVLLTFSTIFEVTGEYFGDSLTSYLKILEERYNINSSLCVHIEQAIISAIKTMGPEKVILTILPANLKNDALLEKSWILPLLREGINRGTFAFFSNYVLVRASECYKKWKQYGEEGIVSMAHTYELLSCQLWGLLPGFCRNPKDPEDFKLIAKTIGTALVENNEFRAPILDGLSEMILNTSQIVRNEISKYSKNFLPRLFNVYAVKPNGTYETELRRKTLDVIKIYIKITDETITKELFNNAKQQLNTLTAGSFESDSILDLIYSLVMNQNSKILKEFLNGIITPILKKEKRPFIPSADDQKFKKLQRKTYELLTELLLNENKNCKKFTDKHLKEIEDLIFDSLDTSSLPIQALRLKCLKVLLEREKNIKIENKLIVKTIPEAVVMFKEFSTKKENVSNEIIVIIGNLYKDADKLNDFIDIVMAGFGGDEKLITNSILALRSIIQNFSGNVTVSTFEFIMNQILVFTVQKQRSEVEASLAFLITFTKILPILLIESHLETIVKSISAMVPDTKRYCRLQIGYLLKKLCKKFTADKIISFVPGNDEVTHRRLKKIKKQIRRIAKKKPETDNSKSDESDNESLDGLEKKSTDIDNILADSDSDLTDEDDEKKKDYSKSKSKSNKKLYIQEDADEIVDLADIKSIGSVLTNKPGVKSVRNLVKKKKENRGFKTATDGRLIISDKNMSSDSDSDETDINDNDNNKIFKRAIEEDSDEEPKVVQKRKRKLSDSSNNTYRSGGKGIHRTLDLPSSKEPNSSTHSAGGVYKAKKAKGDIKKKGKLDPYAYIPLSRNLLNKRKRSKGHFKKIMKNKNK